MQYNEAAVRAILAAAYSRFRSNAVSSAVQSLISTPISLSSQQDHTDNAFGGLISAIYGL
jgi:hypothetical protein